MRRLIPGRRHGIAVIAVALGEVALQGSVVGD
jgi:hypothetical protein